MNGSWADPGVEWVLLALRIAFAGVLYLFLLQVARLMLREMRTIGQPQSVQPRMPGPLTPTDERGFIVVDAATSGLQIGSYIPIAGEILIGRGGSSDLIIPDQFVSTEHAEVIVHAGGTSLIDLGSTNGSKINGEVLTGEATLFDGDIVQFGNVRLRYAATIDGDGRS